MIPGTWLDRTEETIVAPATPRGAGALAVVRLSGPASLAILKRLVRPVHGDEGQPWSPRQVRQVQVVDGETVIDEALATVFHAPQSYTGQDVAELSLHGSPLIVEETVRLACACGARLAQPGEFTLRAVLHGKMDLIQAEAVDQAIRAASRTALQCVARQLAGELSARIAELKMQVVEALAALEMALDFPEEDDAPLPVERILVHAAAARERAAALRDEAERARTVLDREAVVICGPPNVGKSTLFNALLGVDRAIVSGQPGTTRDALFAPLAIGGQLVDVVDTAGLRVSDDAVEAEGVRRAWRHLREALVVVLVGDATGAACTAAEWERLERRVRDACTETVVVANKSDLLGPGARPACAGLRVSALSGEGVEALRRAVEAQIERAVGAEAAPEFRPTERQADLYRRVAAALDDAAGGLAGGAPGEAVSVDLRRALDLLQELLGERVDADILGNIFARFCIGK